METPRTPLRPAHLHPLPPITAAPPQAAAAAACGLLEDLEEAVDGDGYAEVAAVERGTARAGAAAAPPGDARPFSARLEEACTLYLHAVGALEVRIGGWG